MAARYRSDVLQSVESVRIPSGLDVVREGRAEPFLDTPPTLSSVPVQWGGIALENYTTPSVFISRHEHPEHFLHVVLRGTVKCEVNTRGRNFRFTSRPAQSFFCLGEQRTK